MAEGREFGQEQPPLSVYLKRILERYPGGQIFKEIIQNADDAEARVVRFYLDNRVHSADSLIAPGLDRFQGPALLAYNDAKFTTTDWESIQKPEQSGKEKDPFKVGKFGLGFNAVYHITDLPTIISGPHIAFMEPQGKVWPGKAGRQYSITSPKMCSTLVPFNGIGGFSSGISTYPHTLFRFPLRSHASALSEKRYDIPKLKELLDALKDEAQFLLIFLRSVVEVQVIEISVSEDHSTLFEVSINSSERETVYKKRKTFLQELKNCNPKSRKSPYRLYYEAKFHITATDNDSGEVLEKHWLVTTTVGSEEPQDLQAANKQKVLPWVGCALELDKETIDNSGGRVFCFLPLPPEMLSSLPVHVNGTFGLNDNRRSVKWPSKERKHDSTADWNVIIVKSLLPRCYAFLIMRAIKEGIPAPYVYSSWPHCDKLKRTQWSGLTQPLLDILFQDDSAVLWSQRSPALSDGEWITLRSATIRGSEIPDVVHEVLSDCGLHLVDYDGHCQIQEAVRVVNKRFVVLTPALARQRIRSKLKYQDLPTGTKHELLHYCLLDGKFNELEGLRLLPLADESFIAFTPATTLDNHCYVCNNTHRSCLLPNMKHRLVEVSSYNLNLHKELLKVASSNKTQLQKLNPEVVANLLPQCTPHQWKDKMIAPASGSIFSANWCEMFWSWISRNDIPVDLFGDKMALPVVKYCSKRSELHIARLVTKSTIVFVSDNSVLDTDRVLMKALEKFDMYFTGTLENMFPYLQHCKSLREYVNSTAPQGVLRALRNTYHSSEELHKLRGIKVSTSEAESIQHFLPDLSKHEKMLLHLPIFKCINRAALHSITSAAQESWEDKAVMITANSNSKFECNAELLPPNVVLLCYTYHQNRLVELYPDKVIKLNWVEFVLRYLFPMILSGDYPHSRVELLMEKVLEQLSSTESHHRTNLIKEIQNIPFLRESSKGNLVPPCRLFDPSKQQLIDMLPTESFPKEPFNSPSLLLQLCECGLRQTVTAQEIVKLILSISSKRVTSVVVSRAKAILVYLDSNQSMLEKMVQYDSRDVKLKQAIQEISKQKKWLPQQATPPEYYPSCLGWKGKSLPGLASLSHETLVCKSHNMKGDCLKVGSTMCIVPCPNSLSSVLRSSVRVQMVVEHLKEVIKCSHVLGKSNTDAIMECIYEFLLKKRDSYSELKASLPQHWIWLSKIDKFLSTKSVCLQRNPSLQHDLEPYIYVLPESLQRFSSLFKAMGVKGTVTSPQLMKILAKIKSTGEDSKDAWMTVMAILMCLTLHGEQSVELKSQEILYVPTHSEHLHLEDARKVYYPDVEFLQDFVTSREEMSTTDNEDTYIMCHEKIRHVAPQLQLTPLSEYFQISEDLFEDFGPHEPLVLRLKNILRDYMDGITIVKELLQNADDAEATEVNLCYDTRQHSVNPQTLLYPGMNECCGPALIVHNDAMFTDDDFKNITRLAAATKRDKPLKIGKFGVGFCSVYHITDVPCFVSRRYLYIFDPTLQYLKKHIKDKSRPGKRLNFTQKIATLSNQLTPFVGLYGFQTKTPFGGTIFRFPFRTSESDISKIRYTEDHIKQLMKDIHECGPKLLLFLQSVRRITFSRIDEGDETPRVLLDISKETLPPLSDETYRLCIHTTCGNNKAVSSHWLVGTYTEKINFGGQESDAISSVACCMETSTEPSESEQFSAVPICGEVFCFLPLSVKSGLPVHVSANFSVQNDRMGIRSSEEHSANANEAEWNIDLMKHIIPKAYLSLLLCLSKKYTEGYLKEGYTCYSLLPLKNVLTVHNPWDFLVPPVYRFASDFRLLFSPYLRSWLTVSESMFLSPDILHTTPDGPQSVHDCVQLLNLPVVNLPHDYEVHLPLHHTLQEMDFVRIFFQRVDELKSNYTIRNKLIQLIMLAYCHNKRALLKEILQENECVPCTPHGQLLNLCSNVIDQRAFFADLYDPNDGVFPIKEFQEFPINQVLIELGMVSNTLPLSMVAEQALTVQALHSSNDKYQACQRTQIILRCVSSQSDVITQFQYLKRLKTIPFIPVLERPLNYPGFLSWDGDNHTLLAPNQIYCGELCGWLAGSTVCVACTDDPENGGCGDIERVVMNKLGIRDRPEVPHVVNHFQHLIEEVSSKGENCHNPEWVTRMCSVIYQFFEDHLSRNTLLDISSLENCVWTGSNFVTPDVVALHWVKNGPYLFQIPGILADKRHLVATLGIKGQFSVHTYVETLEKIRDEYLNKPVDRDHQEFLVVLLTMLSLRVAEEKRVDCRDLNCYLPDSNLVMKRATALEYNDANWQIEDESGAAFVHHSISRDTAIKLGVRPIRAKILDEYEDTYYEGEEFGQSEELTQRIKNILEDYPLDITVLKELLQNADDAKANKMLVILDKRTHGKSRVPSDEWSDLQGPALLVWNDSTFHKEDMEGIQKLGLGSKRSESETIGMYGIGFNVVYHLTDCPSFISTEKDGESTLCILDPHCRYIPGARKQKPGRRFNNLDQKFWRQWSDMGSAYLRSDELSENIKCGSLFRFPLRHSQELIAKSELVTGLRKPLDAERMETYLKKWAPHMKETLFFLNNVTELQFFVIDDDGTVFQTQHYKVNIDDVGQQCRTHMQEYVHRFSTSSATPHVEHYVLTLTAKEEGQAESEPERWFIQQGVGDIENPEQYWHYLPQMKPKHGIAAPLCVSEQSNRNMHVFCFLPLPIRSHLPVHINGSFVLHSSRRQLWQPTTRYMDDKTEWNLKLIEAIASSYAHLLAKFQDIFISAGAKNDSHLLMESIESYYKIFPVWLSHSGQAPERECLTLAKSVYRKLHQKNASVLVHLKEQDEGVNFLPLMNKQEPWNQPYFYERQREELNPILRKIGMQLTEAPLFVYEHFSQLEVELSRITQRGVFKYYSQYHSRPTGSFKTALISATMFETVEEFKEFTEYILVENEDRRLVFPKSPFNIPLLLTADGYLRMFDSKSKVIRTQFSDLFPNSKDGFLHPEMMDVNYIKDYFLKPQQQCWDVVYSIMSRKLPVDLQCQVVTHASRHLKHDTLIKIWKCFGTDEFFHIHLKNVIQAWALIPSTSNELFSLKCPFLPIMEHSESMLGYQSTPKEIFRILGNLGMPQVHITVLQEQLAEKFCPKISDATTVVKNLFHLHQERSVLRNIPSTVVEPLLQYCGTIHLAHDQLSLLTVKKLPLFRSINGHLCSIQNGAYIWPENMCDEGKNLWLHGDGPVFLDAEGEWTCLNADSILGIKEISPFTLYTSYIFPVFYKLQEQQRMRHLEVIRDSLYDRADNTAKHVWMSNYAAAVEFIKCLEKLHFIPRSDEALCPVCEFADPRKKIFKTFKQHFQFPPSSLQGDKWLDFLVKIGLHTNITTQEYLQFCHEINLGKHSDLTTASHALIDYLFTEKEWHDKTHFLKNVSKIAFVCAESLPSVTWICTRAQSDKVVQQSSSTVHLTSLAKAADYEHYALIWTVKPVVRLPSYPEYSHDIARRKRKELLSALRIYTITTEDVVRNIQNISRTKFSDFQNFETYSCGRKPKDGCDLLEVMDKCYEFLKDHRTIDLSPLTDIPCIPVCADGGIDKVTYPVLVKPIQVIALASDSLQEFMPFLTRLPKKFYSILPSILAEIGVEQAIMLKHVQGALETIHKCIDQELDVNSQRAVVSLIRKLYELLYSQHKFESIRFRVLYLPNSKNALVDSRTLLYKDCDHFRKTTFYFEGSRYSELHLLVPKRDFSSHYKFSEKDLCNLLPPEIAPKPLTTSCREIIPAKCQPETTPSQLAKDLSKACKLPRLASAACAILKHNSNPPEICKKIRVSLEHFFENCRVFSVKHLTVDLRLEIDQHTERKIIGTAEVDFHIKKTNNTFSLYIDKEARKIFFFENLSMAILSQAAEMCDVNVNIIKEPRAALTHLLKAETSNDIMRTLREIGASDVDMGGEDGFTKKEFDPFLNPVLGDPLPESWHHRLQQDYNNLFRPGELVGYEREEDCIVLASIGYKIAGEYEGFAQYCIYLEDEEHEEHIVSVLDIYKIRRSAVVRQTRVNTKEMAVYKGHKETREEATDIPKSLADVKKEICEELKKIWKLPEELKRKAIKRMYLKWHPDKNPDNPDLAEEAFKFLKRQIDRLEHGDSMDDPDAPEEEQGSARHQDFTSHFWESFFRTWDHTAHSHSRYQQSEWRWQSSGFSRTTTDHDQWSDFNFGFQDTTTPDIVKAQKWMRQAECDYKALSVLLDHICPEVCANICFLAHEVAEKSLKAGMFAVWGLRPKDFTNHKKMIDFALNLEQKRPQLSLYKHVISLPTEEYYYKTRWPNMYGNQHEIPAENFSEEKAYNAKDAAFAILGMIKPIMME